MEGWFFVCRRDCHEPAHIQLQLIAAQTNKVISITRMNPRLLGLFAGVDLQVNRQHPAQAIHFAFEFTSEVFAVDGFNDIKQGHRIARLVGLKRPDEVKLYIGVSGFDVRPFPRGLLNPVFPENPVSLVKNRLNSTNFMGF